MCHNGFPTSKDQLLLGGPPGDQRGGTAACLPTKKRLGLVNASDATAVEEIGELTGGLSDAAWST